MRIEVRKSDTFTVSNRLWLYRGSASVSISPGGVGDWTEVPRTADEYDIPHSLAFQLICCMGHEPVYVEDVPSPKSVADPQEEWREAVTEWARTVSRHIGYRDVAVAFDRVVEAAERAKAKENQK